ncbi:MAG TPA: response regulator transcription factor [Sulfurimonas sp.]|nr:response regulator transcription factor [Sulfurimonas sp.]
MDKYKIIIVEDDEITSLHLNIALQKQGYSVIALCHTADLAKYKIGTTNPDLVIIDISLQKSNDGIALAKYLHEECDIPFIFLTSYSDDEIISQAKLTEPSGYIVKPFDTNSLHATIQMALFKFEKDKDSSKNFKDTTIKKTDIEKLLLEKRTENEPIVKFAKEYHIDIAMHETFYQNKKIKLTKKENAFLRLLVAQLSHVVSFDQAVSYVWQGTHTKHNSIRTLVWRLRNKLESEVIKSDSGMGYYIEA